MQHYDRYSSDEMARIQRVFGERVIRDRRKQMFMFGFIGAAFLIAAVLVFVTPPDYRNSVILGLLALCAIGLFALIKFYPELNCPGCERGIEKAWGNYCPECGGVGLKIIDAHYKAHCTHCNRTLSYSGKPPSKSPRIRSHRIRACTNCGVSLGRTSV